MLKNGLINIPILSLLLIFLTGQTAFAQPKSLALLQATSNPTNDPIQDLMFSSIGRAETVFSQLSPNVAQVKNIVFGSQRVDVGSASHFDPANSTLFIIRPRCENIQRELTIQEFLPVAIHEFGHGMFESSLVSALKEDYLNRPDNNNQRVRLIMKNDILAADNLPLPMDQLSFPVHELIADTISVFILNDPDAMSNYFHLCDGESNVRSFTYNYKLEGWTVGALGGQLDRRHEVFNPTRNYIWRKLTDLNPRSADAKAIILNALVDASVKYLKRLASLNVTYKTFRSIDQEQMNRDLIALFEIELAKRVWN